MKYFVFSAVLLLLSCTGNKKDINKFADAELVRIYDWQDKRMTDSMILRLSHDQARYRKEAALAFASIQDTTAAEKLGHLLLNDSDEGVRQTAAFALGQSPCHLAINALSAALKQEKNQRVLKHTLQALGAVLPSDSTTVLTTYEIASSEAEEGKAWGIYKLGLRGIVNEDVVEAALNGLLSANRNTRLASSHFFARASLKDFTDRNNVLQRASHDADVFVSMAATQGLRHVKTDSSRTILLQKVKDNDDGVRISALRALRTFPFDLTADAYVKALTDSSHQVRVASAEFILGVATAGHADRLYQAATQAADWRVQTTLFEAVAKLQPSDTLFKEIKNRYAASTNAYQKAALLNVLGRSAANYSFVGNELTNTNDPIVLSSAALSLRSCNQAQDFSSNQKPVFLTFYKKAIEQGDAAVTGVIAQILGDSARQYKPLMTDITFLKDARSKLSLPKDNEAIQPLEAAIAYLEGRKPPEVKNSFNHPINWELVRSIPANQKAIIRTTQGDVTLSLFIEEAPGSVANFVTLTRQGYFNGKFFHRVVPNFVIQAGCARGDGWGSEDYSIRSEFTTRSYKEGSVGMASAGKDTEGTQWFITHSPTPHLNGRYTIFAEVIVGMSVVNKIGVGDRIIDVTLL